MIPYFTSIKLNEHGIPHGFFTRKGGVSSDNYGSLNCNRISGDDPSAVEQNLNIAASALGFTSVDLYQLKQIHSSTVYEAIDGLGDQKGDALISRQANRLISVYTADCVPVLMYAPDVKIVAAIHAGWKGAFGRVLQAAVNEISKYGADKNKLVAAIGPCIRQENCRFGEDVIATFIEADSNNAQFFDDMHFNLPLYCIHQLKQIGVGEIEDLGIDTYSDEESFFSFRRYTHQCQKTGVQVKPGVIGAQLAAIALPITGA